MPSTKEQRLARARKVRQRTGLALRALADHQIELWDALEEPQNTPLRKAAIYDVLRRAPHISDAGAKKILLTAQVWPLTKLGDLEKIERDEILKSLPPRARK